MTQANTALDDLERAVRAVKAQQTTNAMLANEAKDWRDLANDQRKKIAELKAEVKRLQPFVAILEDKVFAVLEDQAGMNLAIAEKACRWAALWRRAARHWRGQAQGRKDVIANLHQVIARLTAEKAAAEALVQRLRMELRNADAALEETTAEAAQLRTRLAAAERLTADWQRTAERRADALVHYGKGVEM